MLSDRLITVAIHTYERAHKLKNILEKEGIPVTLQNVNLSNPSVSAGVRIRIKECDLPHALRIIENIEILDPGATAPNADRLGGTVLVPVDFSEFSLKASLVAFRMAAANGASVHLIHTYLDPAYTGAGVSQLSDSLTYDTEPDPAEEMEIDHSIERIAHSQMERFEKELRDKIRDGVIPGVKFDSEISEGLPEEAIDLYCSTHRTILTVMGTHSIETSKRELVGSITAEVLDNCRTTVLTVPANTPWASKGIPASAIFFAEPSQQDLLALDSLYRLLPDTSVSVTIVALPSRHGSDKKSEEIESLLKYCRTSYPAFSFKASSLSLSDPVSDLQEITSKYPADMIVIANRKKNIFSRLFNPSLAHRLLFHTDIPLLSIPVSN